MVRVLVRTILGVIFGLALVAGSACGTSNSSSGSVSTSSPAASSTSTSTTGSGGGNLDPQVAMPSGFPSDVPIYTGARLTSQSNFSSNGTNTWGMEWETTDSLDKVQAFYSAKLAEGDWTLTYSGTTNGAFSAIFTRKSNSKVGGILGLDGTSKSGVSLISLALTTGG